MANLLSRLRAHRAVRYASLALTIAVAVLGAAIVSSLTIDLGPVLRARAEAFASRQLQRPVQIGSLRIRVLLGRFEADDLTIAGLYKGDRPFFTAKHLGASLDWSTVISLRPEFTITSVELDSWQMLVEKWSNGDSFPQLRPGGSLSGGDGLVTVSLRQFQGTRGQFAYEDHEASWSVVAPNIELTVKKPALYEGTVSFSGGTISIQRFEPMWANLRGHFRIEDGKVHFTDIDLESDGARTAVAGDVNVRHWPEMTYSVRSRLSFERMRQIFFATETWRLSGNAEFDGVFHLFKGGHDLSGTFASELGGVNAYRFPDLYGSLHWTRKLFEVWDAGSRFYGGAATYDFSIAPLGDPEEQATATFEATYEGVDLAQFSNFQELAGLRFAGSAGGRNLLVWPSGRFRDRRGDGHIVISPPSGVQPMTPSPASPSDAAQHPRDEWGPFGPVLLPRHLPIAGALTYRFDPDTIELEDGGFATERTHVSFRGTTAWGDRSDIPFHVISADWQESQEVLAGILTDFGSPSDPVPFGGRGEFDGGMTGPFRGPRVEGVFRGEDIRAWDTVWGDGQAHIVFENNYLTVRDALVRLDDSEIRADGLFSLGYPRRDGGEEIDARFRVVRRDVIGLRHAFGIDDYPVSGRFSGEFHLTGEYQHPIGFGAMTLDEAVAYGEPFQHGTATLRFDGAGVRLDGISIGKGRGTITGAAFVGWDSTYSFNGSGQRIPVEHVQAFTYPSASPTGVLEFTASGSGTLDVPRYDVRFRVNDFSIASEPVGQVTGTVAVRGKGLTGQIDAASPRLAITGTGRLALDRVGDSELTFRFHDSSLDPYVRLFVPKLSPFMTAAASGSIRVTGQLADADHLLIDGTVDMLDVRLFDVGDPERSRPLLVRNDGPVRLSLDQNVVRFTDLRLVGEDTRLRVAGTIGLQDQRIALRAVGDANLGILQVLFRNVRASGRAELTAAVDGPLREPVFSGSATIAGGRIRHFSLPNALDAINGTIHFDPRAIRLDDVAATMGGGRVQFGGRIALEGFVPGDLNVSVRGENVHLRYPEGVRSTVDANLTLRGSPQAPSLGGSVIVKNATWSRRIDPTAGLFDFGGRSSGDAAVPAAAQVPLRFDVEVRVPSTLRIENNLARLVASASLQLRGTYERPQLIGRADVDRGEVTFEGRRYLVTKAAIEFNNPNRIEPFFDVEAETRVRVPGQTYRVTVRFAGTSDRLQPVLESDPPLPAADVLALLFSDVRRSQQGPGGLGPGDVEVRALQNPNLRQTDILSTRATQLLTNPFSAEVGRVVEQTFGVDTFQFTPTLIDPYSQSATTRVNPSARVTIGKRISDRVYLTFSRSLSSSINDQILLLEYDESDRFSWIVSRNEDQTYAIEVRRRHAF